VHIRVIDRSYYYKKTSIGFDAGTVSALDDDIFCKAKFEQSVAYLLLRVMFFWSS